jgi:hypothetical protein
MKFWRSPLPNAVKRVQRATNVDDPPIAALAASDANKQRASKARSGVAARIEDRPLAA